MKFTFWRLKLVRLGGDKGCRGMQEGTSDEERRGDGTTLVCKGR